MPPSLGCPDDLRRRTGVRESIYKPPLPTLSNRLTQPSQKIEIQLPPLVAGALVASFAQAISDGLGNDLLTHYYLSDQKVRINLDRVLDRLLSNFAKDLWDELFNHYHDSASPPSRQVTLLFDGPIRQIVLILNGPETASCLLERLGPGLSRRKSSWSTSAKGIDLPLALQLTCGYWHREYPALSPGGTPNDIARSLHSYIVNGDAARSLVSRIRRTLFTPHMVQMHIVESAIWDIILKRPFRPPPDGFNIVQFKFESRICIPTNNYGTTPPPKLGSLSAVTGTASECVATTVSEYTLKRWPKCGGLLLECLEEAIASGFQAFRQGEAFSGMSLWDSSDSRGLFCPGLRLLHVEMDSTFIRLSVSAWTHTLIDIFQQMAWTCAIMTASPFPETPCEAAVEIADWQYLDDSVYVNCSLAHQPIPPDEGLPWLHPTKGTVIARGFPMDDLRADPV